MSRGTQTALGLATWALIAALLASCDEATSADRAAGSPSFSGAAATLVPCPSTQSASAARVLGPLGGLVTVGGFSISIPDGALSGPTTIRVTVPASQYLEVDITANDLPSFQFQRPAVVTVDYSRCDPAALPAQLSVWHIDPSSYALLENMRAVAGPQPRTVRFSTGHLSGFALAD